MPTSTGGELASNNFNNNNNSNNNHENNLNDNNCRLTVNASDTSGLHKLWYPSIRDTSTWSKFGAHGEHGDVFLFSNLGAL